MALYYTKGTLSHKSEIISGVSQNSGREWARMTVMLDIPGYQGSITKLAFNVSTDRINDVQQFKLGDKVEIGWTIYAREWKDKWYNSVDLVNIKADGATAPQSAPNYANMNPADLDTDSHNDLPWD